MSILHASRCAIGRTACLRNSYLEISRFCRTRCNGNSPISVAACSKNAVRYFSQSVRVSEEAQIDEAKNIVQVEEENKPAQIDENLRKALFEYKNTVKKQLRTWQKNERAWNIEAPPPVGAQITVFGYLSTRRDVNKKLSFAMLRSKDQNKCIQLVSSPDSAKQKAEAHETLRSLKEWTPVLVKGTVAERKPPEKEKFLDMTLIKNIEIQMEHIRPLNKIPDDLIIKEDTVFGPEQRHLQLRTDRELRENIIFRSQMTWKMRRFLNQIGFTEIETPLLFKSTAEGAREFLVPSRQKGLAYALPQSPQQYKQILMASGFTKYFQFARCFRDEDLRADRQPEFTQLDMELSFANEQDVMHHVEHLLNWMWMDVFNMNIRQQHFARMTYDNAMSLYGSDKPDLRYKAQIHDITKYLSADLISKITPLENPCIDALKISLSSDPKVTRKFVSDFLDSPAGKTFLDNPHGQPGIFISDESQPMGGLGPLGHQYVMDGPKELALEHGDLLVLQARPNQRLTGGSTVLGNLRLALYKAAEAQGLIDPPEPTDFKFVWIHDFPLFTPNNDSDPGQGGSAGFSATHHPFTAPKTPRDVEQLLRDPSTAIAAHYDIVVNGVELGGGSRRIHNAEVQEFIFRDVLKMEPERIEDFRHLLDVLRSGCPPHAGIALGLDRLMAVMRGKESVRDVIAFPKTGKGEDPLVKSPNEVTEAQLETYHLKLK